MIKFLAIASVAGLGLQAMGQTFIDGPPPQHDPNNKVIRRIKIHHADPALIMLMLSGNQSTAFGPEMSTVANTPGFGGFGGSSFGGGNGNRMGGNSNSSGNNN